MCNLVLIKMLKISFWLLKKFLAQFSLVPNLQLLKFFLGGFWLKFDMPTGKRAFFVQLR